MERSAAGGDHTLKDVFSEIDFGSYFQEYLDPGFRTQPEYEDSEKPSFEHFLSQPTTLTDHLAWQLGALSLEDNLHNAVEFVIGNLDEDGYPEVSDEELATIFSQFVVNPCKAKRPSVCRLRLGGERHRTRAPFSGQPSEPFDRSGVGLAMSVRESLDLKT